MVLKALTTPEQVWRRDSMVPWHDNNVVHRAHVKKAQVTLPPPEEYVQKVVKLANVSRANDARERHAVTA